MKPTKAEIKAEIESLRTCGYTGDNRLVERIVKVLLLMVEVLFSE